MEEILHNFNKEKFNAEENSPRSSNFINDSKQPISIFKQMNLPNLEQIISSSQELMTNLIGFAGEIWHPSKPQKIIEEQIEKPEDSSVALSDISSEILVLHRHSVNSECEIKPKKLKFANSLLSPSYKIPNFVIEDDIQPQITNIKNLSLVELSNLDSQQSLELSPKNHYRRQSIPALKSDIFEPIPEREKYKPIEKKNHLFSIKLTYAEDENKSLIEKPKEINNKSEDVDQFIQDSLENSKILMKSSSISNITIPKVFKFRRNSDTINLKAIDSVINFRVNLETSVDLPAEEEKHEISEKNNGSSYVNNLPSKISSDNSFSPLYDLIPKSILYQIPVLSFEEFISALLNNSIENNSTELWNLNFFQKYCCKCCVSSLSKEDHETCEKFIAFSLLQFNFQNSFHLILLLSTYNSISKSDRWPYKDEDWYSMGFQTNNLKAELKNNGTGSLLYIFFLSSYFPEFFSDIIKVRSFFSFNLFELISEFSETTLSILRKQKLNKLIKNYGRGIEVIFFYFSGIMFYWFRQLLKSKDYELIFDKTISKAHSDMNGLLEKAWKFYIQKNPNPTCNQ